MRKHYVLFSCDEWKSYSSMKLLGVFTLTQLRKVVKRKVKKDDFEFDGDLKEISDMEASKIDTMLKYGYIQEISINEEL